MTKATLVLSALLFPALSVAAPAYDYYYLPSPDPSSYQPSAIGGDGIFATSYWLSRSGGWGELWNGSTRLPGTTFQVAYTAINEHAVAIGYEYQDYGSLPWTGFVASEGSRVYLEGSSVHPSGLNDGNVIVGYSHTLNADPWRDPKPVQWIDGQLIELEIASHTSGYADDVNNSGTVVGRVDGGVVLWNEGTLLQTEKKSTTPLSINDRGWFLGNEIVNIDGTEVSRPFIGTGDSFINLKGLDQSSNATAYDLNNNGEIVGTASDRATLWYENEVIDLNQVTPDLPNNLELRSAVGINESGQILVDAYDFARNNRGIVVLSPVFEPSQWSMISVGLVFVTFGLRRNRPRRDRIKVDAA